MNIIFQTILETISFFDYFFFLLVAPITEVQLKKPFKKSSYRSALDKEDPRYLPYGHKKAYERIDLGWEWKFGENGYGYGNDDQEVPNMVKDVCFFVFEMVDLDVFQTTWYYCCTWWSA